MAESRAAGAGLPDPLPEGKVDPRVLAPLLPSGDGVTPGGVLIGAAVGEDAAVVTGAERLVLTSDPITFAGSTIGPTGRDATVGLPWWPGVGELIHAGKPGNGTITW